MWLSSPRPPLPPPLPQDKLGGAFKEGSAPAPEASTFFAVLDKPFSKNTNLEIWVTLWADFEHL